MSRVTFYKNIKIICFHNESNETGIYLSEMLIVIGSNLE